MGNIDIINKNKILLKIKDSEMYTTYALTNTCWNMCNDVGFNGALSLTVHLVAKRLKPAYVALSLFS